MVNAGTVSTTRLRGKTKPCYNVVEASPERVRVLRRYPGRRRRTRSSSFDPRTLRVREGLVAARGDGPRLRCPGAARHRADRRRAPSRGGGGGARPARRRARARRAWSSAAARRSSARGRSTSHYGRPVDTDPEAALRRLAPGRARGGRPGRRAGAPGREPRFALRRARPAPGPRLRGAGRAARPAGLRGGRHGGREARRDRHRQAHRQDRRGRPLGRAAARARRRPGDRVHGPRRAGRAAHGARRASASRSCSRSTPAASTRPPTTSRTRRSRACPRSAAGAWAAAWPASRPSRTCPPGAALAASLEPGRDRVRGLRRLHPAGGGGPHGVRGRARGRPSRSPSTGCCAPTSCWPPRARRRPPGAVRFSLRPEPAEPLPDGRAGGALHDGRGPLRRRRAARGVHQPRPPRRARRGPRPRRGGRAATST